MQQEAIEKGERAYALRMGHTCRHMRSAHARAAEQEARNLAQEAMRCVVMGSWCSRQPGYALAARGPVVEAESDSDLGPEPLAGIEIERAQNMERNREILRQLGLE